MASSYKTIYVHTEKSPNKSMFILGPSVNGDQLARDTQATINKMGEEEMELFSITPIVATVTINSTSVTTTEGIMLVFKK